MMLQQNECRSKSCSISLILNHKLRTKKCISGQLEFINEEDLLDDILDEGIQCSKLPNSDTLRKNMENHVLNRKGSPRKEDVCVQFSHSKPTCNSGFTQTFKSCVDRSILDKDLDFNFNPLNRKCIECDSLECVDSGHCKKFEFNKKLRAHSNELDKSKVQYKLLKLIPCEIDNSPKRPAFVSRKSTIQEDIRLLLRMMAEKTKQKEEKELCRKINNKSDYIVTGV